MATGEIYYTRRVPLYSWRWLAVSAGGAFVLISLNAWAQWGDPVGESLLWGLIAFPLVGGVYLLLSATQLNGEGTRVRLTDESLKLGLRSIPVEQIVAVSAVRPGQVGGLVLSYRLGQRKVGWLSKVVSYDTKAAVVVRDGRRGRRPWWVIDVDDPDRFIEAVRAAQADAREGGRHG